MSEMNALLTWTQDVCLGLTPAGRERVRKLRQVQTEAMLAADRMQVARMLASIGAYQLRMADLSRQHTLAEHPRLGRNADFVVDSLTNAIRDEIDGFGRCKWEERP